MQRCLAHIKLLARLWEIRFVRKCTTSAQNAVENK